MVGLEALEALEAELLQLRQRTRDDIENLGKRWAALYNPHYKERYAHYLTVDAEWNEEEHPRDEDGKFSKSDMSSENRLTKGFSSGKIQTKIAGAISYSGGLNPESEEAFAHAQRYYEAVRKMKTDYKRIAHNTGYPEEEIKRIKDYIFVEEHDLGDGVRERFFPSYKMAESWRRLIEGKRIQPHDLTLLRHEMMERELMLQGLPQDEAHVLTSQKYNYALESRMYYDKIERDKKK